MLDPKIVKTVPYNATMNFNKIPRNVNCVTVKNKTLYSISFINKQVLIGPKKLLVTLPNTIINYIPLTR